MKNRKGFRLALIGTNSMRGKEIKSVLSKKEFPFVSIDFFDSDVKQKYSKLTEFKGDPKVIHYPDENYLSGIDLVFLSADKKVNRKYSELAKKKKFFAIDLNETFNKDRKTPVVVAGVNDWILQKEKPQIIANPHPVAIILSHIFNVISTKYTLLKAVSFVMQPASAYEESGIGELANQSVASLSSASITKEVFKTQVAFNLLSHTELVDKHGFTPVEKQIVSEIKRILNDSGFPLALSLVQAPVFHTYSIMSYLELKESTDIQTLEDLFKMSPYFKLLAPVQSCPVSSISVAGKDEIFIGQIKKDNAFPNNFWIWSVADNLTRGSALNAFEIAKLLYHISQT